MVLIKAHRLHESYPVQFTGFSVVCKRTDSLAAGTITNNVNTCVEKLMCGAFCYTANITHQYIP